jgi:hypothetical protein
MWASASGPLLHHHSVERVSIGHHIAAPVHRERRRERKDIREKERFAIDI